MEFDWKDIEVGKTYRVWSRKSKTIRDRKVVEVLTLRGRSANKPETGYDTVVFEREPSRRAVMKADNFAIAVRKAARKED